MGLRRLFLCPLRVCAAGAWAVVASIGFAAVSHAFVPQERWGDTATALASPTGRPVTLTWSIVPDGTVIQGEGGSELIQFLDGVFGAGPGGSDLQQRPWFSLMDGSFTRWSAVSGLSFLYESNDDLATLGSTGGQIGTRGDVRIGGAFIDGGSGTLAYSFFPSNADSVFDTGDATFFSNATQNYLAFRNTFTHELGHGIGLDHVVSNTDRFLMEPSINIGFDGPQLDDIRGAHWYYGDALEKSNGGQGNETPALATHLGLLTYGTTRSIGAAAASDTVVEASETDFVSIANSADADYFSFDVLEPMGLNAVLIPWGGVFNQGPQGGEQSQFNANARSDLTLAVYDTNGTSLLGLANQTPAGEPETLTGLRLPAAGKYFARIIGSSPIVQMYQLDLTAVAPATLLPGDFNRNGEVDAADYVMWRDSLDQSGPDLAADANHDLIVDVADYDIWLANFGASAGSTTALNTGAVPEPAAGVIALVAGLMLFGHRKLARALHRVEVARPTSHVLVMVVMPICVCWPPTPAAAIDRMVSTTAQFSSALAAADPGDRILLQPGVYAGGHFRADLRDVHIRSADPTNRAIFDGGANAIQLSDAQRVTISDLEFRNQTGNGLNIDDGGSFNTPSTEIVLRNITVRDIAMPGNRDGIKLSGVTGFLIDGVRVHNWGTGGSAVDMVGCHDGLVQNSLFAHENAEFGGTTLQPKGGSKRIAFRANRIELPRGSGRAVQAGGSTGAEFFRFIDGDSNYEADEITAEGNVIVGGMSAFSWVNIDGGVFHHNFVHRPGNWVARILNENQGNPIVDTRNGRFHDNRIVYNDVANEFSTAVNVGPETVPASFQFARNRWLNLANPSAAGSTPTLPTTETGGTYGDTSLDSELDDADVWDFDWGKWIVNANDATKSVEVPNFASLRRAVPDEGAEFRPLEADPLVGQWTATVIPAAAIELPAFSQVILVDPQACPNCLVLTGDYNNDGLVNQADYETWRAAFGTASAAADGNGDGTVDAADYVVWRRAAAESNQRINNILGSAMLIPEPHTLWLAISSATLIRCHRVRT